MQKIDSATTLRAAIIQLEATQADEGKLLKGQSHLAYESIMPINLIKNTIKQASSSNEIQSNLLIASVGLTSEYLSEKIAENTTLSPFKKLLGSALLFGATCVVIENQEAIKSVGLGFMEIIIRKFANKDNNEEDTTESPTT